MCTFQLRQIRSSNFVSHGQTLVFSVASVVCITYYGICTFIYINIYVYYVCIYIRLRTHAVGPYANQAFRVRLIKGWLKHA